MQEMTIESLDAFIRAEPDRKKNPHDRACKRGTSSTILLPPKSQLEKYNGKEWMNNNHMNSNRMKGKCHCRKNPCHFKRICRKYKAFLRTNNLQNLNLQNG